MLRLKNTRLSPNPCYGSLFSKCTPSIKPISRSISFLFCLLFAFRASARTKSLTIYAAASTIKPLTEVIKVWEERGGHKAQASFASSAVLARQIVNGAPADIFLSADPRWIDYLSEKTSLPASQQHDLLGNSLVFIVPFGQKFPFRLEPSFDPAAAFSGRLSVGDPEYVPLGMYTKEALLSLGWWDSLQNRLATTPDPPSALQFVVMGECRLGVVYATDVHQSSRVEILAHLPPQTHRRIVYPIVLIKDSAPAHRFLDFILSPAAKKIFMDHGFTWLPDITKKTPPTLKTTK